MARLHIRFPTRVERYGRHSLGHSVFPIEVANDLPLLGPRGARSGKGLLAAFAASICLWALIGFAVQRLFAA